MTGKTCFVRRISRLMRIFWLAAVCDAAYVLYFVRQFAEAPAEAMARGASLSAVPAMTEHVLMSAALLVLAGAAAEILRRTY